MRGKPLKVNFKHHLLSLFQTLFANAKSNAGSILYNEVEEYYHGTTHRT